MEREVCISGGGEELVKLLREAADEVEKNGSATIYVEANGRESLTLRIENEFEEDTAEGRRPLVDFYAIG